ncbi:DUF1109 family protein [Leptospira semungkisensis]|uniref:DUF1109 family protein n=1 Tax=Leptospira semungkisensis TaxID=2484985 RepID=A0A4V3JAP9_9LEPT|nr:DUF1109 family protein [Leptospira semungkisensis]TGJ99278.1 DUF1109 family protein [Leptospira semungkisensis]
MSNPKNDKTDELIRTLSADLQKGSLNFNILFLSWLGLLVSGLLLGWSVSLLTNRPAFSGWWPEPALVIIWGVITGYLLSKTAYPEESSIWIFWGAGAAIFLWIGFNLFQFASDFHIEHVHIGPCPVILAGSSLVLGGIGWFAIRKMASSRPGLSAFLFLSFIFAASNLCLKFLCPVQEPSHVFLAHVLASLAWILIFWIPLKKKFVW